MRCCGLCLLGWSCCLLFRANPSHAAVPMFTFSSPKPHQVPTAAPTSTAVTIPAAVSTTGVVPMLGNAANSSAATELQASMARLEQKLDNQKLDLDQINRRSWLIIQKLDKLMNRKGRRKRSAHSNAAAAPHKQAAPMVLAAAKKAVPKTTKQNAMLAAAAKLKAKLMASPKQNSTVAPKLANTTAASKLAVPKLANPPTAAKLTNPPTSAKLVNPPTAAKLVNPPTAAKLKAKSVVRPKSKLAINAVLPATQVNTTAVSKLPMPKLATPAAVSRVVNSTVVPNKLAKPAAAVIAQQAKPLPLIKSPTPSAPKALLQKQDAKLGWGLASAEKKSMASQVNKEVNALVSKKAMLVAHHKPTAPAPAPNKRWSEYIAELKPKFDQAALRYRTKCASNTPAGPGVLKCGVDNCYRKGVGKQDNFHGCVAQGFVMGPGMGDKCACGAYNDECKLDAKVKKASELASCYGDNKASWAYRPYCTGQTKYAWHEFLDTILIINLKRRPDRRHYMTQMLLTLGVPQQKIQFFDAVDVKQWGTVPFQARLALVVKNLEAHVSSPWTTEVTILLGPA